MKGKQSQSVEIILCDPENCATCRQRLAGNPGLTADEWFLCMEPCPECRERALEKVVEVGRECARKREAAVVDAILGNCQ